MSERLDRIESLLTRMAERQMAHDTQLERIQTQLSEVAERQSAHDSRFERLETQLSEVNATLDRIVQGQARNENQIGHNAEAISELRSTVTSCNQRLELLEQAS